MDKTWKDLILGMVALVAAFVWPTIAELNPPFDAAGWSDILVWLGGLLLAAIFGWKMKLFSWNVNFHLRVSKGSVRVVKAKPIWFNLLLGILALLASVIWPEVAKLNPPFDGGLFKDILIWLTTVIFTAIFGWNMAAARRTY